MRIFDSGTSIEVRPGSHGVDLVLRQEDFVIRVSISYSSAAKLAKALVRAAAGLSR